VPPRSGRHGPALVRRVVTKIEFAGREDTKMDVDLCVFVLLRGALRPGLPANVG